MMLLATIAVFAAIALVFVSLGWLKYGRKGNDE